VLAGKKANKIKIAFTNQAMLFFTFVFFTYYALSTGGRRPLIYPVIICYLVISSLGRGGIKVSAALLGMVFIVAGLGTMIKSIDPGDNWWTVFVMAYNTASQGLGDSYIHFVAAQNADLWQFGFLTDIANLPRDFLPSQLFGFERSRNMLGETSEFILGHPLDEGVSGEEPLGLHGY